MQFDDKTDLKHIRKEMVLVFLLGPKSKIRHIMFCGRGRKVNCEKF